jgi:hypothetical protein
MCECRVKPLVWVEDDPRDVLETYRRWQAGDYEIIYHRWSDDTETFSVGRYSKQLIKAVVYSSLDAAKAAAQADFETRIRTALESVRETA